MNRKKTGNSALADIAERKFWKQYMKAYEECLNATSTELRHGMLFPPTTKRMLG